LIGALHRGRLHDDDSTFLDDPVREATATARAVDADPGRIETRAATVSTAIAWPQADYEWPGPPPMSRVLHRTLFADPVLATRGETAPSVTAVIGSVPQATVPSDSSPATPAQSDRTHPAPASRGRTSRAIVGRHGQPSPSMYGFVRPVFHPLGDLDLHQPFRLQQGLAPARGQRPPRLPPLGADHSSRSPQQERRRV
jgi:hypothetical protein